MSETTAVATIDETTLSGTQRDMLNLLRTAVADAERVQPKKEKRTAEKILLDLVLDGTDEDIKGLSKFREILRAKAAEIHAQETGGDEVSEDERKKVREQAKAAYTSAKNVLDMPAFRLPEGFVLPDFPGARGGGGNAGQGGEKPRNLKHTVTNSKGEVVVDQQTFAVISQRTKEPAQDLLARFKDAAGIPQDTKVSDVENLSGPWTWEFVTGEGENSETYSVTTTYTAPA